MKNEHNNKRIAKNSSLLYFRMLCIMAVSLYTSRIVLDTLGIEDFGIYSVAGGVIAMFGFVNSSMASATQRYITFELGRNNNKRLAKVFSTSLSIHGLISLIVILLAETIGLWFLWNKMQIPAERLDAAFWVFQCSVMASVIMIMSVPYNAAIIAHEKMSVFAYISILEVILKLLIVYLLLCFEMDKLILYAVLMVCVQLLIRLCYGWYCSSHFEETRFYWVWDKILFKEMTGFAGWSLFGNLAAITFTQGLNILLNLFFGPAVNAARGISVQVQQAISQFSVNLQMAINPQITKSYANGDLLYMHGLIFRSAKFSYFLLLLLSLPILFETEMVLTFWLKNVPDYTVTFLRIMLCITWVNAISNPLVIGASATGRIKIYQIVVGGILLLILPFSYLCLKLGFPAYVVFVVHLCIEIVALMARLWMIRPMINLSFHKYCVEVFLCIFKVTIIAICIPLLFYCHMKPSYLRFFMECLLCFFSVISAVYLVGLTNNEQKFIRSKIFLWISKTRK